MGEHHCNICTIISGGVVVGVGLDLMDHKSHLSLGCSSTYGWEVHWYQVLSQM